MQRLCKGCQETHPATSEYWYIRPDGFWICRIRSRAATRKSQHKHKLKNFLKAREWRHNHRDKIAEYGRNYRKKYPEKVRLYSRKRYQTDKIKVSARAIARAALEKGMIIKKPCLICGNEKSEMHHPNYSSPLSVEWLCRLHHMAKHRIHPDQPIDDLSDLR